MGIIIEHCGAVRCTSMRVDSLLCVVFTKKRQKKKSSFFSWESHILVCIYWHYHYLGRRLVVCIYFYEWIVCKTDLMLQWIFWMEWRKEKKKFFPLTWNNNFLVVYIISIYIKLYTDILTRNTDWRYEKTNHCFYEVTTFISPFSKQNPQNILDEIRHLGVKLSCSSFYLSLSLYIYSICWRNIFCCIQLTQWVVTPFTNQSCWNSKISWH